MSEQEWVYYGLSKARPRVDLMGLFMKALGLGLSWAFVVIVAAYSVARFIGG